MVRVIEGAGVLLLLSLFFAYVLAPALPPVRRLVRAGRRRRPISDAAAILILYAVIFVPGALVHVGDGHAIQGDGEIVGTGIEISMDVQFTVRLIKGKRIEWPRGESADYIFTVGNARPLDQAVQHATSEMLRWLREDYGLDTLSASILLGQCVEYDLGNVFDPAYTMICKLRNALLVGLT